MKKKILGMFVCMLLMTTVGLPSITGEIRQKNDTPQLNEHRPAPLDTDWWPMFGHDLSHSRYSTSLGPDTNNSLWSYTTGDEVLSSPAVADGKVYIGSYDGTVYCLDAPTGGLIWSYITGRGVKSSPAVADGKVYVGCDDANVYCLNATTGGFIWNFTTGDEVRSSPAVADGKVYVGSWDGTVYCLDASTGGLIWNYTTGYWVTSSPAVADGKVYIGFWLEVLCLDASTGGLIWSYPINSWVESSPAVATGKVYVGSNNGFVYCLNATTGGFIWACCTNSDIVYSSPAVAGGKVYVGLYSWNVCCLDALTGGFIWNYTTGSYVSSSPAVADGKVYIGSNDPDNKVYCLDASTGGLIWNYTTDNYVSSSPAVANGKVYVGSGDGKVYCFGSTTAQQNLPILDLINIKGGLGSLSVELTNRGNGTAENISWVMNATANLFSPKLKNGTIGTLGPGENATIQIRPVHGLGKASVTFVCTYRIMNLSYNVDFKVKQEWRDRALFFLDFFPQRIQPTKEWVTIENYSYVNGSRGPGVEFIYDGIICNMHNVRVILTSRLFADQIEFLAACKFTNGHAFLNECWITKDMVMGGNAQWELELVDGG